MSDLGDLLELLFTAAHRTPAMSAEYVRTVHPAAVNEMRRLGQRLPVPFGAVARLPFDVLPGPRDATYEVWAARERWRTLETHAELASSADAVLAGFDGTVRWTTARGGVAPPARSPLFRLLDPTWLLRDHDLAIGSPASAADRPAVKVAATARPISRLGGTTTGLGGGLITTVAIDREFGFLLSYEQRRGADLVASEKFTRVDIGNVVASEPDFYKPPAGAARSDDTDNSWAAISPWKLRVATAAPLVVAGRRVLRGKPPVRGPWPEGGPR